MSNRLATLSVLYVEDEDVARQAIGSFLKRQVRELLLATNGAEGLQLYREHRPDVVITDLEMPVMTGMEMIRRIRELAENTPIIITTAFDDEAHRCTEADLVIVKPVNFIELLEAVERTVNARQYRGGA